MVDTNTMGSGDFLTPRDMKIGDKVKVTITDEGKIQPAEGEFKAALILGIKYNGKPMSMRLGIKNKNAVAAKLQSAETKNWVGKELEFLVYQTNYQNKLGFQFVG